jgi:hypothetical protein
MDFRLKKWHPSIINKLAQENVHAFICTFLCPQMGADGKIMHQYGVGKPNVQQVFCSNVA